MPPVTAGSRRLAATHNIGCESVANFRSEIARRVMEKSFLVMLRRDSPKLGSCYRHAEENLCDALLQRDNAAFSVFFFFNILDLENNDNNGNDDTLTTISCVIFIVICV